MKGYVVNIEDATKENENFAKILDGISPSSDALINTLALFCHGKNIWKKILPCQPNAITLIFFYENKPEHYN